MSISTPRFALPLLLATALLFAVPGARAANSPPARHGLASAPAGLVAAIARTQAKDAATNPSLAIAPNGCAMLKTGPRGQVLHGCFGAQGSAFTLAKTRLHLRLTAWGREGALRPVAFTRSATHANRIANRGRHLTEWWQVLPMGYEQGFTLNQAPAGHGRVVLQLRASASPTVEKGTLAWGALRYGKLQVTDANGTVLPATLAAHGRTLTLAFNAAHARYPITVDPLVWVQQAVTASNGTANDRFGTSVALSGTGNTALVGAPYKRVGGNSNQGAAYVYTLAGGTWGQTQYLIANNGTEEDRFGTSVALSSTGTTALVGASYKRVNSTDGRGAAYVYTLAGGTWDQTAELTAIDGAENDHFGNAVGLSSTGTTALVGSPNKKVDEDYEGAAYVYTLTGGTLTANGTRIGGTAPNSVAVDPTGRYAYVTNNTGVRAYTIGADGTLTANGAQLSMGSNPVSVAVDPTGRYAYVANNGSNTISMYTIGADGTLTANGTPVAAGSHPYSVAVDPTGRYAYVTNNGGGTVSMYTIGAGGTLTANGTVAAGSNPSSVAVDPTGRYVYVANTGGNTVSMYTIGADGTLTANGTPVASGDSPVSVAVDPTGRYAYVANTFDDTVSVYTIDAGGALTANGTPVASGSSPNSVAVDPTGRYAYVANYFSNSVSMYTIGAGGMLMATGTVAAGSGAYSVVVDPTGRYAYVANNASTTVSMYTIDAGGTWSQTQELTASNRTQNDRFGTSVALSSTGTTVLVGAPYKRVGSNSSQGAAYVYTLAGGTWGQTQYLTASNGAASDRFGSSVALSSTDTTALVGAPYKTVGVNTAQGAAYVYTLAGGTWSQTAELTASNGAASDRFGTSVALSSTGATALVGASNKTVGVNTAQGAAYVYTLAGGTWSQTAELTASNGAANDYFGFSVALSWGGPTALVGAYGKTIGVNATQGSAYFFGSSNLSAVLSAPANVEENQTFGSQYILTNTSATASAALTAMLPVPATGASYVAVTATQGSCSYDSTARVATCDLGPIAGNGGSASATLQLKATGSVASTIAQSASLANGTPNLAQTAISTISLPPPPTLSGLNNVTVTAPAVGSETFTVTGTGTLTLTATSSNTTLLPDAGISGASNCTAAGSCTLTLTPAADQTGTATITVTVTDADSQSASGTFTFTVNATPTPPALSGTSNLTVGFGQNGTETFTVSGTGTLTLTATSSNPTLLPDANITGASSCTAAGSCTLILTPAADQSGTTTVSLQVADTYGQSATGTFTFTVNKPAAPTLSGISNLTVGFGQNGTETFMIAGTGTLTLTATSSNPTLLPNANITGASACTAAGSCTLALTPAADQNGMATVTVTLTDAYSQSVSETFTFTVNPPDAPTLSGISNLRSA